MKKPKTKAYEPPKADFVVANCTFTGASAGESSIVAVANALKAMADAALELAKRADGNSALVSFNSGKTP